MDSKNGGMSETKLGGQTRIPAGACDDDEARHEAGFADSPLPTQAGPGRQTRQFVRTRWVAPEMHVPRTSSFQLVLAFALGAIAYASGVYVFQVMNPSSKPPPNTMTANTMTANTMTASPVLLASPATPVETNLPVPATERPGQGELQAPEVWEVQARLEFLGMQPGSPDGIPGPRTVAAIGRYEQSRGRTQTGKLDRELLERLRLEPN
jgi:hypothetical protein